MCAFSQVSGPDWGPNATYLSPSGLENLNYCTFSSQKRVWFDLQLRPLSVQFSISAFSQTAGNKLVCQRKFVFNFHVHINPEYIIFIEIKYILNVISWCLLVDLKQTCNHYRWKLL